VVIVGGTFEVDPDRREEFLRERHEAMRTSRAEAGCLDYAFSADPIEPGRVLLFERWTTQEALDAHLNRLRSDAPAANAVPALKASLVFYDAEMQPPTQPSGHGTATVSANDS
jgi:quinol monooxygenase YgiN